MVCGVAATALQLHIASYNTSTTKIPLKHEKATTRIVSSSTRQDHHSKQKHRTPLAALMSCTLYGCHEAHNMRRTYTLCTQHNGPHNHIQDVGSTLPVDCRLTTRRKCQRHFCLGDAQIWSTRQCGKPAAAACSRQETPSQAHDGRRLSASSFWRSLPWCSIEEG